MDGGNGHSGHVFAFSLCGRDDTLAMEHGNQRRGRLAVSCSHLPPRLDAAPEVCQPDLGSDFVPDRLCDSGADPRAVAGDQPLHGLSARHGSPRSDLHVAPDPATSPSGRMAQILFGGSIAVVYMILMSLHVAFALFYSLTLVCLIRGVVLTIAYARNPAFGDVPDPEVAIPPQTFSGAPHSERKNPPPQASIGGPY